ncbi:DUF6233 domain-containing protein [Streptomyces sp. NPDC058279]|uniref:DUF6233 domain-containing protein n=1 Tax=Streptomyces sp. NPDC058279 TaxID=3346418 RepID=UPI0036E4D6BF
MSGTKERLERWRAVQAWLTWQQYQVARTIAALEAALAEEQSRLPLPPPPDWKAEAIRTPGGPQVLRVHLGVCGMGKGKPIGREQARRMLADGVEACPYRGPDTALGMPG